METVGFDDLPGLVGKELGVSDWLEITQERINLFAEATDDRQWIHVDVERANREMGGTIAHGYLTLSLIPRLSKGMLSVRDAKQTVNYGSDKVRFLNVIRVGQRVRIRQQLTEVTPKGGGVHLRKLSTIEIEGEDKPACIADTISVVYR